MRANREKAIEMSSEKADALDSLLEKLRNGETIRKGHNKARPSAPAPIGANIDNPDFALNLLASMQSGGFELPTPSSPTFAASRRRRNRRNLSFSEDVPTSPLSAEIGLDFSEATGQSEKSSESGGDA